MTFRPNKERFILLLAVMTAALVIMFNQASAQADFFSNAVILLLAFGASLYWLSRFEICFEGDKISYTSLFGGKVQFREAEILSIKPNKSSILIHLLYTKRTLFIQLKNGEQIKINTKVFPAEVAEILKKLTLRLQAQAEKESAKLSGSGF
ncbi:MAG TPA: hypothetical protein VIR78_00400 [Malonomonas sp.]